MVIRAEKLGYTVVQFGVDYFARTRRRVDAQLSRCDRQALLSEMRQLRKELREAITPVV